MSFVTTLIDWTNAVFLPLGGPGLLILAFIEAIFFPIPPDLLLIAFSLAEPHLAFWFALLCTVGSVSGALVGYAIGAWGKRVFLERFFSAERIDRVHDMFKKYDGWAIFIAGFTPIPYKVFTLAAGVFNVNKRIFIIASILSRGLRYFLIAGLLFYFGEAIRAFLENTFNVLSLLLVVVLVLVYAIYRKF